MNKFDFSGVVIATRKIFEIVKNSCNTGMAIQIDEKNKIYELCKKISDETFRFAAYQNLSESLIDNILNKTNEIICQLETKDKDNHESQ